MGRYLGTQETVPLSFGQGDVQTPTGLQTQGCEIAAHHRGAPWQSNDDEAGRGGEMGIWDNEKKGRPYLTYQLEMTPVSLVVELRLLENRKRVLAVAVAALCIRQRGRIAAKWCGGFDLGVKRPRSWTGGLYVLYLDLCRRGFPRDSWFVVVGDLWCRLLGVWYVVVQLSACSAQGSVSTYNTQTTAGTQPV